MNAPKTPEQYQKLKEERIRLVDELMGEIGDLNHEVRTNGKPVSPVVLGGALRWFLECILDIRRLDMDR